MGTVHPFPEPAPPALPAIVKTPEMFLIVALLEALPPDVLKAVGSRLLTHHCAASNGGMIEEESGVAMFIFAHLDRGGHVGA